MESAECDNKEVKEEKTEDKCAKEKVTMETYIHLQGQKQEQGNSQSKKPKATGGRQKMGYQASHSPYLKIEYQKLVAS